MSTFFGRCVHQNSDVVRRMWYHDSHIAVVCYEVSSRMHIHKWQTLSLQQNIKRQKGIIFICRYRREGTLAKPTFRMGGTGMQWQGYESSGSPVTSLAPPMIVTKWLSVTTTEPGHLANISSRMALLYENRNFVIRRHECRYHLWLLPYTNYTEKLLKSVSRNKRCRRNNRGWLFDHHI